MSEKGKLNRLPLADINDTELWKIFVPKPKEVLVSPEMAYHCFDFLISNLRKTIPTMGVEIPNVQQPVFVSWSKLGHDDAVKGSAGTYEPVPLLSALQEFSVSSALHDSRFRPIKYEDIPDLQVTVAILCDFEQGFHFLDWTVGIHGLQLILEGRDSTDKRSATFLPEFPIETGWTKVETIDALIRNAGFIGKITGENRQGLKLTRFQTQKITKTYEEFNQFRNWKTKHPIEGSTKSSTTATSKSFHF